MQTGRRWGVLRFCSESRKIITVDVEFYLPRNVIVAMKSRDVGWTLQAECTRMMIVVGTPEGERLPAL
jgi:hypothetical protein